MKLCLVLVQNGKALCHFKKVFFNSYCFRQFHCRANFELSWQPLGKRYDIPRQALFLKKKHTFFLTHQKSSTFSLTKASKSQKLTILSAAHCPTWLILNSSSTHIGSNVIFHWVMDTSVCQLSMCLFPNCRIVLKLFCLLTWFFESRQSFDSL